MLSLYFNFFSAENIEILHKSINWFSNWLGSGTCPVTIAGAFPYNVPGLSCEGYWLSSGPCPYHCITLSTQVLLREGTPVLSIRQNLRVPPWLNFFSENFTSPCTGLANCWQKRRGVLSMRRLLVSTSIIVDNKSFERGLNLSGS